MKRFASVLAAPRQAEGIPGSHEIDCTAMVEKAKQPPPKEAKSNVMQARPAALDDLDIL